jgi:hypothetical protein
MRITYLPAFLLESRTDLAFLELSSDIAFYPPGLSSEHFQVLHGIGLNHPHRYTLVSETHILKRFVDFICGNREILNFSSLFTYLDQKVSQMLFELWNIIYVMKQSVNCRFDLREINDFQFALRDKFALICKDFLLTCFSVRWGNALLRRFATCSCTNTLFAENKETSCGGGLGPK